MERLQNTLLEYAWGSRTALAELLGEPSPSPRPQAEMWMGAHPAAPSVIAADPARRTLADRISASPVAELGEEVCRRFEGRLPFLLKILAAETPLSLQTHPSLQQAREGYAREESERVPHSAPHRNYKDTSHKPEILCALGSFEALCGFRTDTESLALLEMLGSPALHPVAGLLRSRPGPQGTRAAFEHLMTMDAALRPAFLDEVLEACEAALNAGVPFEAELRWSLTLAQHYPGDIGAASSLLLNLIRLEAGQAIYLPAGTLHTYLRGVGVELMASSDNVLRAGLTPKHVDVPEVLRVLDFSGRPFTPVAARQVCAHERRYLTPTADFRLSVIEVRPGETCRPARRGPEILLCVRGRAQATLDDSDHLELARGMSAFVSASDAEYSLTGDATIFRATVGDPG